VAAFTGGSLLIGTVGRPDLVEPRLTEQLARAQYASAHRLAEELDDEVPVLPTHGFGSFCSGSQAEGDTSTIGRERRINEALTRDVDAFVADLLAGLDDVPAYYAHMGPANIAGPGEPDLTAPRAADPAELRRRIDAGEWVVDLRSRIAFAAGHLPGALNFELGTSLATYLGWLIPWAMPLTLIGDTPQAVAAAQRDLCRIGVDKIEAAASGPSSVWAAGERLEQFPTADFAALAERADRGSLVLVDVRRLGEWRVAHIQGAIHIPLHELAGRLAEIPAGEIWVHCEAGYRAAVAASLLAARGRQVVAINDRFSGAEEVGLPVLPVVPVRPGLGLRAEG
jgi:rhodanese-related sulfurtransferase